MYLYIFENGTAKKSKDAPSYADLDSINAGILSIYCILVNIKGDEFEANIKEVDSDGELIDIEEAVSYGDYHA